MDKAAFVVFSSELRSQLNEIEAVYELVRIRAKESGQAGTESLGFQLHNLYCACEDLFKFVAAAFENHIDPDGGYHIELLKRMRIPMAGVRPRVISDKAFFLLDSLRGFRHVFRHAYGTRLDERKVGIVLDDAQSLHGILRVELEEFLSAIEVA